MRCCAVFLKAEGLSSAKIGVQMEDEFCFCERMGEALHSRRHRWSEDPFQSWSEAHHGLLGRGSGAPCHQAGQAVCEQGQDGLGVSNGQESERDDLQTFFISIGARYKRIRKRPRGEPSLQLYAYKSEKSQEPEERRITLYYANESHVCTEGLRAIQVADVGKGLRIHYRKHVA